MIGPVQTDRGELELPPVWPSPEPDPCVGSTNTPPSTWPWVPPEDGPDGPEFPLHREEACSVNTEARLHDIEPIAEMG